jgi:protein disulfide-isomerase A1
LTIDDIVFVAHLTSQDKDLYTRVETLARKYHDRYSFAVANIAQPPAGIGCYNNLDNIQRSTAQLDSVDALAVFVKECTIPVIPRLTRRNEAAYLKAGKSLVYYFTTTDSERDSYVEAFRSLAKKYGEYLSFVTVDTGEYGEMVPNMGLAEADVPGLAVQNPRNGQVFPFSPGLDITPQAIEAFLMDISGGKVKPWDREQPPSGMTAHDEL